MAFILKVLFLRSRLAGILSALSLDADGGLVKENLVATKCHVASILTTAIFKGRAVGIIHADCGQGSTKIAFRLLKVSVDKARSSPNLGCICIFECHTKK